LDKSDNQQLVEYKPKHQLVIPFVEKYQLYMFDSESWIKTLPNARLEFWQIFDGQFHIWNESKNCFLNASSIGGYPATNSSLLFHVPEKLYCLNIKFHLRALAIPLFQKFYPPNPYLDLSESIEPYVAKPLSLDLKNEANHIEVSRIDDWVIQLLGKKEPDPSIDRIVMALEQENIQTVEQLSEILNYSPRNLQRIVKTKFNLGPKELLSIVRFSQTTSHLSLIHI